MFLNGAYCFGLCERFQNKNKRQNALKWFEKKNFDILLIQETHCNNIETENEWKRDWNVDSVWNYGSNLSKGVSVLFNKTRTFDLVAKDDIEDGRVTSIKITINDHKIQIINLYASNNSVERKRFNINLSSVFDDQSYILAGDFNCAQDNNIDRKPRSNQYDQGFHELEDIMKQYNLEDIFQNDIGKTGVYFRQGFI